MSAKHRSWPSGVHAAVNARSAIVVATNRKHSADAVIHRGTFRATPPYSSALLAELMRPGGLRFTPAMFSFLWREAVSAGRPLSCAGACSPHRQLAECVLVGTVLVADRLLSREAVSSQMRAS